MNAAVQSSLRSLMPTAALVAAVCFVLPAAAQSRLSLSERVNRLEQQVQGGTSAQQNMMELLNRLNELQGEVQSLRGIVEQQSFELEALKKRSRDQYLDLDTRIQSLSGAPLPAGPAPTVQAPPPPPDSSGMMAGEPEPTLTPRSTPDSTTAEALPPPVNNAAEERAEYDQAFEALKQGKYSEASRLFAGFVRKYPSGEYVDNATYWLGESYYVTQNYKIALQTFQQLMSQFPNSGKASDALLKIGYCHQELGDRARAAETLRSVIQRFPQTPVARLAQTRLRALELESAR